MAQPCERSSGPSLLLFELADAPGERVEVAQVGEVLHPVAMGLQRQVAGVDAGLGDRLGDQRPRRDHDVVGDAEVAGDAGLPADHAARTDAGAAGDPGTTRHDGVLAHAHVVRDLNEVVELDAVADHGVVERAAVDRGVGADLDVVADDDAAGLRDLDPGAGALAREAEAVGADDHARVQDAVLADHAVVIDADVGVEPGATPDAGAATDMAVGADHHVLAEHHVFLDRRARPHLHAGRQGARDRRERMDAGTHRRGRIEELRDTREIQVGVGGQDQVAPGQRLAQVGRDDERARGTLADLRQVLAVGEEGEVALLRCIQRRNAGDRDRAVPRDLAAQAIDQLLQSEHRAAGLTWRRTGS